MEAMAINIIVSNIIFEKGNC